MGNTIRVVVLCAGLLSLGVLYVVTSFPQITGAVQMESDAKCSPVKQECFCGMFKNPSTGACDVKGNQFMCPCKDTTSGATAASGICMAEGKCLATQAGGMMPMLPMIPMMMPKMMMMMMPQDPCMQPGAGTSAIGTPDTASATTSTSTPATDPCAGGFGGNFFGQSSIFDTSSYFNDTSSGISDSLFDDLNKPEGTVSNFLASSTAKADTNAQNMGAPTTSANLTGSIKVGEAGASVVANLREGVAEVAGFFGGSTFGGAASQSIAGRLCASRPWTSGAVSKIIPPAFFDTLCSKAGYQVGVSVPSNPPASASTGQQKKTKPADTKTPKQPINLGPVEIDIWAEPASVRLGTRTYIFWTSKGVIDCTVSGANFTQNALSGGASTVPLSGATTYSLECTRPDGTKVSDSVTVNLAI